MQLEEVSHTYTQETDACVSGICNILKVSTFDGGGGPYLVIETERWAIDEEDIEAFAQKLRDVLGLVQQAKDNGE